MLADRWNRRVGSVWAEIVDGHVLGRDANVIEVGPGFADKIGLGLARIGFRGTLFVVEPNDAARHWITRRYRELLEEAHVVPVGASIASAAHFLPDRVDGLFMNHVLDDLVLHAALQPSERNVVFGEMRPGTGYVAPRVRSTWLELLSDRSALRALGEAVLEELCQLLLATEPRLFAASQYASWTLDENGLAKVNSFSAGLLRDLEVRLGGMLASDRATLSARKQDPKCWLVLDRRPDAKRVK